MFSLKYCSKIVLVCFLLETANVCAYRTKRALIYTQPGSKVQMIVGAGYPVAVEDISVVTGYVFKANYYLPTNVTDYTEPGIIFQRRKRSNVADRWSIYRLMSKFMIQFGGKACVLRSICEAAEVEFDDKFGFIEEIFHVIFRPSVTKDELSDTMDRQYLSAEDIGKSVKGKCHLIYPECKFSLLDMFTK